MCVDADDASSVLVQSTRLLAKLNGPRVHQMCAQATYLLSLLVAAQVLPGHSGDPCCPQNASRKPPRTVSTLASTLSSHVATCRCVQSQTEQSGDTN